MVIKSADGTSQSVASNGLGNTAVTLGAIGTGLGLLNGGLGIFGNNGSMVRGNEYITRHELDLVQQLQAKDIMLASKDSEIALKTSESYTDAKMVEVYAALKASENQLRDEVRANKDAQQIVNAQQMAWNATANTQLATMANQIANQAAQLASITTNVVPSNKVCDTCCCGCNN